MLSKKLEGAKRYRARNKEKLREKQKERYRTVSGLVYAQKYRKEHVDKLREQNWRAQGIPITFEEYTQRFQAQAGRCKICSDEYKTLVVDHCHKTGKVRGLLCQKCNLTIGRFEDDFILMAKAIRYLLSPHAK